jgi:hypothetical protein
MISKRFSYDRHLRRKLAENVEYGLPDKAGALTWIQDTFRDVEFTRIITVTFKHPETDPFKLEKLNQSIANRIRRCFYSRRPESRELLKFLFLIEEYPERVYGEPDYHLHFLMTEPKDSIRDKHARKGSEREFFDSLIRDCIKGSRFTGSDSTYCPVADIDIRLVVNQADRIAYLSKALATSDRAWIPDLKNSSFPRRRDAKGKAESAH